MVAWPAGWPAAADWSWAEAIGSEAGQGDAEGSGIIPTRLGSGVGLFAMARPIACIGSGGRKGDGSGMLAFGYVAMAGHLCFIYICLR